MGRSVGRSVGPALGFGFREARKRWPRRETAARRPRGSIGNESWSSRPAHFYVVAWRRASVQVEVMILVILFAIVGLFYWMSALSFYPVPWPDDSAFFLAAQDWFRW